MTSRGWRVSGSRRTSSLVPSLVSTSPPGASPGIASPGTVPAGMAQMPQPSRL
jgi:hypothetical protein